MTLSNLIHFVLVLKYKSKLNLFYMFEYINVSLNDIKLNVPCVSSEQIHFSIGLNIKVITYLFIFASQASLELKSTVF
jgi:hypothetical protein